MADDNSTQPRQADGQDSPKRHPDGMAPGQRGRNGGGESGGGGYSDGGGRDEAEAEHPKPSSEKA